MHLLFWEEKSNKNKSLVLNTMRYGPLDGGLRFFSVHGAYCTREISSYFIRTYKFLLSLRKKIAQTKKVEKNLYKKILSLKWK